MKLTTAQWTNVQNRLPPDEEGRTLWDKIEARTWGKRWSQSVAIALMKPEQRLVDAALAEILAAVINEEVPEGTTE